MPRFGLIDETQRGQAEFALQQARLHVRAGKYRFRHGKLAPGIAALYDALSYAMCWYSALPEHRKQLGLTERMDYANDRELFLLLVRAGVLGRDFDFDEFETFVDEALACEIFRFDPDQIYAGVATVLTRLGVMPFDEGSLPAANPESI